MLLLFLRLPILSSPNCYQGRPGVRSLPCARDLPASHTAGAADNPRTGSMLGTGQVARSTQALPPPIGSYAERRIRARAGCPAYAFVRNFRQREAPIATFLYR